MSGFQQFSAASSSCPHQPFLLILAMSFHVNTRHSWPRQPWLGSPTISCPIPVFSECVVLRWEGESRLQYHMLCTLQKHTSFWRTGMASPIGSSKVGRGVLTLLPGCPLLLLLLYPRTANIQCPSLTLQGQRGDLSHLCYFDMDVQTGSQRELAFQIFGLQRLCVARNRPGQPFLL